MLSELGLSDMGISVGVKLPKEASAALKQVPALKEELTRFNAVLQRVGPGFKSEFGRTNTLLEKGARALPFIVIGGVVLVLAVTLMKSKK